MTLFSGLMDLIFPMICTGCGLRITGSNVPLCPFCAGVIQKADGRLIQQQLDVHAAGTHYLGFTFALWMYDKAGVVQRVHHALKYQNRPEYGVELGRWMAPPLMRLSRATATPDLIVPLPLHRSRRLERGYNQSAMLARGINEATGIPIHTALLNRSKTTLKQTGLGQSERWHNVKDAFQSSIPRPLQGAHILLVDDILTTGATMLAAAKSLFDGGASCISLATLAFTRP